MILFGCYLISADGRPLVWQVFQSPDELPEGGLLSPLLTSIQGVALDLVKREGAIEKMNMGGITYHMQWMGDFFVVLVTDTEEKPDTVMNNIGRKFLSTYQDRIRKWNGDISMFEDFTEILLNILDKNFKLDVTQSINPTKRFDTKALFNLDKSVKDTALAIFSLKTATAEEIAQESGESEEKAAENLDKLKEMGYIGFKVQNNEPIYFY